MIIDIKYCKAKKKKMLSLRRPNPPARFIFGGVYLEKQACRSFWKKCQAAIILKKIHLLPFFSQRQDAKRVYLFIYYFFWFFFWGGGLQCGKIVSYSFEFCLWIRGAILPPTRIIQICFIISEEENVITIKRTCSHKG